MIAVDLQVLQSPSYAERGIGRFTAQLVTALERDMPGLVDTYLYNDALADHPAMSALTSELHLRPVPFGEARGRRFDALLQPCPNHPLRWSPGEARGSLEWEPPVTARRMVTIIHDLIPLEFSTVYLNDRFERAAYLSHLGALTSADTVLTTTEYVAASVHARLGVARRRIDVIGGGVGGHFVPSAAPSATRLARLQLLVPELQDEYVLGVVAADWRKNLDGLLCAYARLPDSVRDRHQLALLTTMAPPERLQLDRRLEELGVHGRVVVTGHLPDDDLPAMYETAAVVVVPSIAEGFGLPVLEARRSGARVICSRAGSMPEVLPDPRAWFDPTDAGSIADVLERSLVDDGFRRVLADVRDPGLNWATTARRVARALSCGAGAVRPPRARRRLAVVAPLPPAEGGVASHSAQLVHALHHLGDEIGVDVAAFTRTGLGTHRPDRPPVHPLAALPLQWHRGEFDAVLYCLGNDDRHRPVYDMARRVPGAILTHDVRLTGLYGPAGPGRDPGDDDWQIEPVASLATELLVHSRHAADLVETVTGRAAIDVGPLPAWSVGDGADELGYGPPDGPPVVASLGIAHRIKQTDLFVAAGNELAARRPVEVAVVGPRGELFVGEADAVRATGPVGDDEFDGWLRRATVLVQLRGESNGESSGVAVQAALRGTPLIVSDIGALAELPATFAHKVPVEITAGELADVIEAVLDDEQWLSDAAAAARAYAAEHSVERQARRIVEALGLMSPSVKASAHVS